jgi:hypothetical protein
MPIAEYLPKVTEQLRSGNEIGRRATPVVSFWPMREKWKRHGEYWHFFGTDGDCIVEGDSLIVPATLKLIYFLLPDKATVCQLAFITEIEERFPVFSGKDHKRYKTYCDARESRPAYD